MRYHQKLLCAAALGALMLAGTSEKPAQAAVVLDQSSLGGSFGFGAAIFAIQSLAQTFAVGVNGMLHHIDVELFGVAGSVDAPLVFNVLGATAGVPNATVLATISLDPSEATAGIHTFDVSADNIAVTVGQTLAFALSSATSVGPGDYAGGGFFTGYGGGDAFSNCCVGGLGGWHAPIAAGTDLHFQTFVDQIPEPATLGLIALGLGVLGLRRRRA